MAAQPRCIQHIIDLSISNNTSASLEQQPLGSMQLGTGFSRKCSVDGVLGPALYGHHSLAANSTSCAWTKHMLLHMRTTQLLQQTAGEASTAGASCRCILIHGLCHICIRCILLLLCGATLADARARSTMALAIVVVCQEGGTVVIAAHVKKDGKQTGQVKASSIVQP